MPSGTEDLWLPYMRMKEKGMQLVVYTLGTIEKYAGIGHGLKRAVHMICFGPLDCAHAPCLHL